MNAAISYISYILPEKEYSNEDFFRDFPAERTNRSLEKVGIQSRRIIDENETAEDLAYKAGMKLFQDSGIEAGAIDFLIFNSPELNYYTPATSCELHWKLGLKPSCGTLDINHGCSGYTYSLMVAKGLITSGQCKNILMLNSSSLTKELHAKDKASRFVFGDAASATLISASDHPGIMDFVFGTEGKSFRKIIVEDGGGKNKLNEKSFLPVADEYGNVTSRDKFYMDGTAVFLFTLRTVPSLVEQTLIKNNITKEEVDFFILHQANAYILEVLKNKIKIPDEKFIIDMAMVGNTVASTIPIALKNAMDKQLVRKGNTVLIAGFGTGLSWSAAIVKI